MKAIVRKAIIPVAGLGTRFLPITKAIPKEMLAIVDKPAIHFIVEEAFSAGIEQIVLVNGHHKYSIENYFDINYELNDILRKKDKAEELALLHKIAHMGAIFSVRQKFPYGLGHAVLCGEPFVGEEPFAVLLGDDIVYDSAGKTPAIGQLIAAFKKTGIAQVGVLRVEKSQVHKYGAVKGIQNREDPKLWHISDIVEKPPRGTEDTDLVVIGRYVLTPEIWNILSSQKPGSGGEIQLTDSLVGLLNREGLMGCYVDGERIDTGDRIGLLRLNIKEALNRAELREDVLQMMKELLQSMSS